MYYGGERNVPGAPGNLMAGTPHGKMYEQQPREYLNQRMPAYPPGFGPQPQQAQPQLPQPGTPVQLELPLAAGSNQGFPPMGNAGTFASVPQGPYTPLPAPGWNPGMIKPPGNPNFRPAPQMERIGPTGERLPWQAAGFQNKFVS